jgi:hypothetical protein
MEAARLFELMLGATLLIIVLGVLAAYDGSRDPFHPLIFTGPMMAFLYFWMPTKLLASNGLGIFFTNDQLVFVQLLNVLGILAFVVGCLMVGTRVGRHPSPAQKLSTTACFRLRVGAVLTGSVGLTCWLISIHNVGGFVNAFSRSYSGGWDDNGYIRDGNLLLLVAVMLAVAAIASEGGKVSNIVIAAVFGLPWITQALLMARRGPTFAFAVVTGLGFFLLRAKRPPLVATVLGGVFLGWLALFLVTNRSNIYLGSSNSFKTDSSDLKNIVEKPDTGNEYIYGSGSVIAAEKGDHYFWMRRYLAQLFIRPIPSSIWKTKYEDFGVPELLHNAGTGEGIADTLGWVGAVGSAPGIIADLWIELWWLAVVAMGALGFGYGYVWRKAVTGNSAWKCQFIILSALSMYLVMQTMEAVIFRSVLLSVPSWLVWRWALAEKRSKKKVRAYLTPCDLETLEPLGVKRGSY